MLRPAVLAGIDLGVAADNHSMGVIYASNKGNDWTLERLERLTNYEDPNQPYIDSIKSKEVELLVIDAPLWFEDGYACRRWEKHLRKLVQSENCFSNWEPSQTHALYSHAWRAKDLLRGLKESSWNGKTSEIFPAAWFALTYSRDRPNKWKGDGADDCKRQWGFDIVEKVQSLKITITNPDMITKLNSNELDALPCIMAAIILFCRQLNEVEYIDSPEFERGILFPSRSLWSDQMLENWSEGQYGQFLEAAGEN